jgi:hypothetical protein
VTALFPSIKWLINPSLIFCDNNSQDLLLPFLLRKSCLRDGGSGWAKVLELEEDSIGADGSNVYKKLGFADRNITSVITRNGAGSKSDGFGSRGRECGCNGCECGCAYGLLKESEEVCGSWLHGSMAEFLQQDWIK